MMKKEKMTYEAAYAELQQIVAALQSDSISIDDLSEKVKRAGKLVAFCQEKLRTIENEMTIV
jgi:exodeoxyribonuclease VII small subunit